MWPDTDWKEGTILIVFAALAHFIEAKQIMWQHRDAIPNPTLPLTGVINPGAATAAHWLICVAAKVSTCQTYR